MQSPLQIAFRGVESSEAAEGLIREKVEWLEKVFGRVVGCRVVIEAPHRSHQRGNLYKVSIDLSIPGDEIVVNRDASQQAPHRDLAVAIRDAFDCARRRLDEHARRRRG